MTYRTYHRLALASFISLSTGLSYGAAFQLQEQSALLLGSAFSGSTLGKDAAMAFYNPAALVNIKNQQVVVSEVTLLAKNHMQTNLATGWAGESITGVDDNPSLLAVVPGLYYAARLNDKVVFGLGATVPFGLKTEYSDDSYVRYLATTSEVQVIDLMPTIGYSWDERLALGAGFDLLMVQAELDMRSDTQGIGSSSQDAWQKNRAHDISVGYHLGFTYNWTSALKVGFAYHSAIGVKMGGESKSTAFEDAVTRQRMTTDTTLPGWFALSAEYRSAPDWTWVADLAWTHWDRIQELTLGYASGVAMTLPLHFQNARRIGVGVHYQWADRLLLRAGTAFEESPVTEAHRSPRVPDTNRVWLSVGAGYRLTKNMHLDFGYGHIFFKAAHINNGGPLSAVTDEPIFPLLRYEGTFKGKADLIGLQLSWDYV
jgi:long-chain fatty acid transport protein